MCPSKFESLFLFRHQFNVKIAAMEREMTTLADSASLFEVNIPDFKQLKQCRKEIALLKTLWDYTEIVRSSIDDWKTTPWLEINVEQMEMDCKKFAKDLRALDKEMRAWDTYTGVESTVKNMLTSLRAVSELQNPAIRDRHWQQLMQATGVRKRSKTSFSLNLHICSCSCHILHRMYRVELCVKTVNFCKYQTLRLYYVKLWTAGTT